MRTAEQTERQIGIMDETIAGMMMVTDQDMAEAIEHAYRLRKQAVCELQKLEKEEAVQPGTRAGEWRDRFGSSS